MNSLGSLPGLLSVQGALAVSTRTSPRCTGIAPAYDPALDHAEPPRRYTTMRSFGSIVAGSRYIDTGWRTFVTLTPPVSTSVSDFTGWRYA